MAVTLLFTLSDGSTITVPAPDPNVAPPSASPPPSGQAPFAPAIPVGYSQYWVEEFTSTSAWLKTGGGMFAPYVMNQGGTDSYNTAANAYTENGMLRLRTTTATTGGGKPFSSAYVGTNQSNGGGDVAHAYLPLFARYRFGIRYPFTHCHWPSLWLNWRGSSSELEIDLAEMFTAQVPGQVQFNVHSPSHYGTNLLNKDQTSTTWKIPSGAVGWGGKTAGKHYGRAIDFDDPFAASHYSGWHLVEVEIRKVPGTSGGGWTVAMDFSLDGIPCVTWQDNGIAWQTGGKTPAWYVAGDDLHALDIRYDCWVGGSGVGRPVMPDNTTRVYTYDGFDSNDVSNYLQPVGKVPNADIWKADPTAPIYADLAYAQVLTKP
jgi:hypothetical protein